MLCLLCQLLRDHKTGDAADVVMVVAGMGTQKVLLTE